MITIFYGDKVITSATKYKNSDFNGKITNAEQNFFSSQGSLLSALEKWDVIFVENEREEEVFDSLKKILKPIDAAGGVVKNAKGQLLMIFRLGKWDLPKGKREKGEDMATCALREVEEECGVSSLSIENFRANTYHIYPLKNSLVLKTTAWYNMTCSDSSDLVPQSEEDIAEAIWVDSNDVKRKLENSYPTIIELL